MKLPLSLACLFLALSASAVPVKVLTVPTNAVGNWGPTNGLASTGTVATMIGQATNGLVGLAQAQSLTNGFISQGFTNGLASTAYVIAATSGVKSITNGFITAGFTNGFVGASITNDTYGKAQIDGKVGGVLPEAITNRMTTNVVLNGILSWQNQTNGPFAYFGVTNTGDGRSPLIFSQKTNTTAGGFYRIGNNSALDGGGSTYAPVAGRPGAWIDIGNRDGAEPFINFQFTQPDLSTVSSLKLLGSNGLVNVYSNLYVGGSVGIGSTVPVAPITVYGPSAAGNLSPTSPAASAPISPLIRLTNNFEVALDVGSQGASPWGIWQQVRDIRTTATYPLLLNPLGGNVGIGTNAPSYALDVNGTIRAVTSHGVILNAADSPLITRGWDAFTSGKYNGLGRWGVFMESAALSLGVPNVGGNGSVKFLRYNADSTFITNMLIDTTGNLLTKSGIYPGNGTTVQDTDYFSHNGSGITKGGSGYTLFAQGNVYVQNSLIQRGVILNDGGAVDIQDDAIIEGTTTFYGNLSDGNGDIVMDDNLSMGSYHITGTGFNKQVRYTGAGQNGPNYSVGNFTTDATWRELTLSPYENGVTKCVWLRVSVKHATTNGCAFSITGNSGQTYYGGGTVRTQELNINNDAFWMIQLYDNNKIYYKGESASGTAVTFATLDVTVVGYTY